jgi:hypothetical protein
VSATNIPSDLGLFYFLLAMFCHFHVYMAHVFWHILSREHHLKTYLQFTNINWFEFLFPLLEFAMSEESFSVDLLCSQALVNWFFKKSDCILSMYSYSMTNRLPSLTQQLPYASPFFLCSSSMWFLGIK